MFIVYNFTKQKYEFPTSKCVKFKNIVIRIVLTEHI